MNFRQRVAWLLVLMFLAGSFGLLYYVFEVNDHYNTFALEHAQKYHSPEGDEQEVRHSVWDHLPRYHSPIEHVQTHEAEHSFWGHVTDVPLSVWVVILLLPYLQMFFMILACTRAEPRLSLAFQWPGTIYIKYRRFMGNCATHKNKSINSAVVQNGHIVIDT